MDGASFDIDKFRLAFEGGKPEEILAFYADDLEHVEIDQDAPPRSPRTSGIDGIREAFEGLAQAGIPLKMGFGLRRCWQRRIVARCSRIRRGRLMLNPIARIHEAI